MDIGVVGVMRGCSYGYVMSIAGFDHAAVPIENVEKMLSFYYSLGFQMRLFDDGDLPIHAATLGNVRLNFHEPQTWTNADFPRGPNALPGCGDFCFVWDGMIEDAIDFLSTKGIQIELGPVERTGARGQCEHLGDSVYFRDPDQNLLEFIAYRRPA